MDFWSELIKVVISNGIFAILFVYLLFYQLKDSQKREQAYRKTIEELSTHLIIIEKVRDEVNELKNMLQGEENEKV
ncbi:MAG: bacteriocin [Clostridia bacterium]|nr:bacteriocin [Clostridia bacterium]